MGTYLFAGFINWTTNGRSILPMIVPTGILIVRSLERVTKNKNRKEYTSTITPLFSSLLVSYMVLWGDVSFANASQTAATQVFQQCKKDGQTIWFQGHWGFQYYMQALGGRPINTSKQEVLKGDIIVVPTTNTNIYTMNQVQFHTILEIPKSGWCATVGLTDGVGFYADIFWPLPFVIELAESEHFDIYGL
jgi:hypothetical protein